MSEKLRIKSRDQVQGRLQLLTRCRKKNWTLQPLQQQHASTEREKSLALEPTAREKWYEHRSPWKLKMSPSEKTWGDQLLCCCCCDTSLKAKL
jgi:hypothetical protein